MTPASRRPPGGASAAAAWVRIGRVPQRESLVGAPVPGWTPPHRPARAPLAGAYCRLEPLDPDAHAADLWEANLHDRDGHNWTYLFVDRPADPGAYLAWTRAMAATADPLFFAIVIPDGRRMRAAGVAAYLRIAPEAGSIEVGHINFSPLLQRTPAATEAMYLMMRHAFELGYRRYEWKCDSLNAPSRAAAQRLGLSYEGVFRQALVYKGRNRDTAWYAAIDAEWPALRAAFERWLDPANFDDEGRQRISLSSLTAPVLVRRG
jgi:RimJ/RimL family protein N-acetyltransferase